MPKRKRSGSSPSHDDDVNPTLARQRSKLLPLLDRSKKTLVKTLKLARGFERQKLSRRLKTASSGNDGATVARVTREIEALKSVRFEALAEVGLGRQLAKVKRVREHEAVPPWVLRAGVKGSAGTVGGKGNNDGGEEEGKDESKAAAAAGNKEILDLQARLFNARATREVMSKIVDEVRACLGVSGEEKSGDKGVKKNKDDQKSAKPSKRKEEVESQSGEEVVDGEPDRSGEADGADDFDSEDEFAGFSDRIAASSDEEDNDGDNTGVRIPPGYKPTRDMSVTPDPSPAASEDEEEIEVESAYGSDSNDDDEIDIDNEHATFSPSASGSASPPPSKSSRTPTAAAAVTAPTKSTFIPSLSAVGYISGSDSDSEPEDIDERVAPARKNRRGQRARQAIWEKKYGEKAAHVQKAQQKAKTDRNAGWDAKRGATDGGAGGARGKGKGPFQGKGAGRFGARGVAGQNGSGPAGTEANTTALGKRKTAHRDDEGKLHPSWEAKKRLKEQATANVKFEGKRITFD